jgi:hypothetical protein
MFDPNRPRAWAPPADALLRTENDKLCAELRAVRAENEQLHQMLASQAKTITAVQRLVGAPAPATINATVDVRLEVDKQLTPATKKEIEAFVERLQRLGDAVDR